MIRSNLTKSLLVVAAVCLCLSAPAAPRASGQTGGPPPPPKPEPLPQAKSAVTIVGEAKPKLLPYKAAPNATAPQGWQKYEFGDAPFLGALLPIQHEAESDFVDLGGKTRSRTFTFSGEIEPGVYILHFVENMPLITERMSESYRQKFYDGLWQGIVQAMKGEMEKNGLLLKLEAGEKREVTVGERRGHEQDFLLGPLNGKVRVVLWGQRAVLAIAMELEPTPSAAMIAFLNSLEVRAPR